MQKNNAEIIFFPFTTSLSARHAQTHGRQDDENRGDFWRKEGTALISACIIFALAGNKEKHGPTDSNRAKRQGNKFK